MKRSAIALLFSLSASVAMAQQGFTKGVVQKIKPEAGLVTVSHERLENLDLPAMTTLFRLADPAMMSRLSPGQKIEFTAKRINGKLSLTGLR